MKAIARNWKAVLALILMIAAVVVYFRVYKPKQEAYIAERDQLNKQIAVLQTTVAENERYKDVQDLLPAEYVKMEESRDVIYEVFPDEIKEEDQLMYLLYLEKIFAGSPASLNFSQNQYLSLGVGHSFVRPGTIEIMRDIHAPAAVFNFGQVQPVTMLSDQSVLNAMDITLSYNATYDGFKKTIEYLATDSRVASIRTATFQYDVLTETLCGDIVIRLYSLDASNREYTAPTITNPGMGKENLFKD